jgi:cytochrome c-type biogenesis protein CcmE
MTRRKKYLLAGLIVLGALGGLIYSGVQQSMVYFYTPTELKTQAATLPAKALRVGGMVQAGSIRWDKDQRLLTFALTDGQTVIPVRHTGTPPDLFKEGAGAVVEGTWAPGGYLQGSTIMAKHSEEYKPPAHPETLEAKKSLFQSLMGEKK